MLIRVVPNLDRWSKGWQCVDTRGRFLAGAGDSRLYLLGEPFGLPHHLHLSR